MSDLFQAGVPDDYAEAVSRVMATANWHTYQVLTKRSERLLQLLSGRLRFAAELENIWWGVSVEDRKHGLPRVDHLRRAPAKVRFLSIEPLLEDLGEIDLSGITWVIVGGREWAGGASDEAGVGGSLFGSNAGCRACHFSLSNGVGCERLRTAGCLMGGLMMSIRSAF